ncbi:MAG: rRNA maturation RNase YbeY [Clostridiales bacterium]|nr:MAG: rRNA maturation RNase YbeY [Clostridiales bacterium]
MKLVKRKLVQIEEGLRLRKKEFTCYCRPMERIARRAAELEGLQNFEVQIILADNDFIHQLNRDYRQVDAPTDVISFPANDLEKPLAEALQEGLQPEMSEYGDAIFLGEIYISVDRAQEQAEEYGNTLEEELCFLTVHGMLHLMGYDHIEAADEQIMRAKQREILGRVQQKTVKN